MSTQTPESNKGTDTIAKVELTKSQQFEILSNKRRRHALAVLLELGGMTRADLVDHVAAREHDSTIEAVSASERKSVAVSLYQTHLKKIDGAGAVAWDRDGTDHVYPGPRLSEFAPYVDYAASRTQRARDAVRSVL